MHKDKSPEAFRTISEAATEVGEEAHVLRFWEKQIKELSPTKNDAQRRYYRPEDIMLLHAIRYFLRQGGYKIEGVKKLLQRNGKQKFVDLYNNRNHSRSDLTAAENIAGADEGSALNDQQLARLRILNQNMIYLRDKLSALTKGAPSRDSAVGGSVEN